MINFYLSDKDYEDNTVLLGIFDWEADNSWYDDLAVRIINDVDKTEVIAPNVFRSEFWGTFSQDHLSGGVKMLLCLRHPDNFISKGIPEPFTIASSLFGDNCTKWIVEISKEVDVNIKLRHFIEFPHELEFEGYAPELDMPIRNRRDVAKLYLDKRAKELMNNKYGTYENPIYDYEPNYDKESGTWKKY